MFCNAFPPRSSLCLRNSFFQASKAKRARWGTPRGPRIWPMRAPRTPLPDPSSSISHSPFVFLLQHLSALVDIVPLSNSARSTQSAWKSPLPASGLCALAVVSCAKRDLETNSFRHRRLDFLGYHSRLVLLTTILSHKTCHQPQTSVQREQGSLTLRTVIR